jgi:tRNA threonylcarbamoyl adenosine modification protein YeaZ
MAKGQAERLMPLVDEIFAEAGKTAADLGAIGVGIGPGNFTGLRISVSAARGLALALARPAIGVSVFEARRYGIKGPLSVIEDARRDEAYLQSFDDQGRADEARLVSLNTLSALELAQQVTGSLGQQIADAYGRTYVAPPVMIATAIAHIAEAKRAADMPFPRPAPLYLRAADAAPARDYGPRLL